MSILSRFMVLVLFLLIEGTPIAALAASDPVIFFNARKYWGNIDIGYFGYNQKNEVVFIGRNYKKNKKTYTYNIDRKKFGNISKEDRDYPNGEVGLKDIDSYYNWKTDEFGVKIIATDDDLRGYTELDPSYKKSDFDNAWIALIIDHKQKLMTRNFSDLGRRGVSVHFRYLEDSDIQISPAGDLYLHPQSDAFFYKIPIHMRGTIIVRDRLVYAPIRYLVQVWNNNPDCTEKKMYHYSDVSDDYKSDFYEEACLISFFTNLKKGDYDADSFDLITPR